MMTIGYDNLIFDLSSYEIIFGTINEQLAKVNESRDIY